jgi:hypothetical protein
MATAQAAKVGVTWEPRLDPSRCEHLTLKLEPSGCAGFTGNFYCTACGESIIPSKPIISVRPRASVPRVREAERTP